MPLANLNGIRLYYELTGQGNPLLLISGTGGDLRNPSPHLSALEKFQLLRYDQRGLGQTDKPDTPYSMEIYADDAASLLTHLNIKKANVIGISFGGMVAQHLSIRHPELVDKLILACTSPGGQNYSSYDLRSINGSKTEKIEKWMTILDSRYEKNLDELPIIKATKEVLLAGAPIFPNLTHNGLSHQLEARAQHDCLNDLECVNHKTLIVGGTYDLIAPKANLVKLHETIRNSRLEFFEGGHLFLIQDDRAWPVITSFLSEESDSLEK